MLIEKSNKKNRLGVKLAFLGWLMAIASFSLAYYDILNRDLSFFLLVGSICIAFIGTFLAGREFKKEVTSDKDQQ